MLLEMLVEVSLLIPLKGFKPDHSHTQGQLSRGVPSAGLVEYLLQTLPGLRGSYEITAGIMDTEALHGKWASWYGELGSVMPSSIQLGWTIPQTHIDISDGAF